MSLLPYLALCLWPLAAEASGVRGKLFEPSLDPAKSVFFFENSRTKDGPKIFARNRFTDPEGKTLVEEEFHYIDGELEKYIYTQHQINESGTIEIREGKVHYRFSRQGEIETEIEDTEPNLILADMIPEYLAKHWDKLESGDTLKVRYLLLERQETIGFKFFKDGERTVNGKAAVDIVMKPTSIFIAALAPKVRFTLAKAEPHRVLESFGRMPIRIPEVPNPKRRKDYRAIDARMEWEYME